MSIWRLYTEASENEEKISKQQNWIEVIIEQMLHSISSEFWFTLSRAGPRIAIGRAPDSKSGVLGSIPGLVTYFRFSFRFSRRAVNSLVTHWSRRLFKQFCFLRRIWMLNNSSRNSGDITLRAEFWGMVLPSLIQSIFKTVEGGCHYDCLW